MLQIKINHSEYYQVYLLKTWDLHSEMFLISKFLNTSVIPPSLKSYPIKNYRCCTGGPLSIMGDNSPCIFPICHEKIQIPCIFPIRYPQIWHEIWHTCISLIYREKLHMHAERLIYREKESLYAERNGYYWYCNKVKKIVLRASICIFSS